MNAPVPPTYTDDQLVARYIQMRDFLSAETAAQAKYVEPYVKGMEAIGGELHRRLLERNPGWRRGTKASGSTEHGTFFLKTSASIKVADRIAFHDHLFALVREGRDAEARAFLTAHVAKEAVEEYIEKQEKAKAPNLLPPGVTLEFFTECQIRKA